MGLFLNYYHQVDPDDRYGTVDFSGEHEPCRCKPLVVARLLFVMVGLPVLWGVAIWQVPLPMWEAAALVIGGSLIYISVAYLVNPQPDLENLGFAFGTVDNPYRFSDNWNRMLLSLQFALGPGRFVAESVLDAWVLFQGEPGSDEMAAFGENPAFGSPPVAGGNHHGDRPSTEARRDTW